ncbi:MAG: hypothetical protein WBG04_18745 [Haloferula sp.]
MRLEGLVESYGAPSLDLQDGGLIEILKGEEGWMCYDRGRFQASCRNQEELINRFHDLRDRHCLQGFETKLVVSAQAETPFREIREVVRTAAKSGICDIRFLVDQVNGVSKPSALPLSLALAAGCAVPPEIEPFFIIVDADEKVSVGTGPARVVMDRDRADRTLTHLDRSLWAFHRVAAATSSVALVQIYVAPSASYQRMIDVLACVKWNKIDRPHFTDILDDGPVLGCSGLPMPDLRLKPLAKPRAPSSGVLVRPPGLDPHEGGLPESPFGPDSD